MGRLSALTVRGRAFLAAGLTASACALVLGQTDLLRVGMLLLLLPLVSLAAVVRSRYRLSVQRVVQPPRVPVGEPASVRLELANLARLPTGLLMVEDRVPYALGARPRFVLDRIPPRWTREIEYAIRCDARGVYDIGPLSLRLTDPFGLVELSRSFRSTEQVVVTPEVVRLPALRLRGEWSGSGEHRPRSVAAAGEEDATIREYRDGDDLRRVHWRATARHDRLMVRREEQPWQSRCTILLDSRVTAHAGHGPRSSFEWAVRAAASAGVHQLAQGYAVRLLTDEGGAMGAQWHDVAEGHAAGDAALLDALAVVQTSADASIGRYPDLLAGIGGAPGVLVAVLGTLGPDEAQLLARLRHGTGLALAIVLDTPTWAGAPPDRAEHQAAVASLREAGWRVATAHRGDDLARIWTALGPEVPVPAARAATRETAPTGFVPVGGAA